jgi:hypothetical protein
MTSRPFPPPRASSTYRAASRCLVHQSMMETTTPLAAPAPAPTTAPGGPAIARPPTAPTLAPISVFPKIEQPLVPSAMNARAIAIESCRINGSPEAGTVDFLS